MEKAARRFASWVLSLHFAVLLLVIAIVALAARGLYYTAREQAVGQVKQRQELLTTQTARGIKNFYSSVLAGLEIQRRAEQARAASSPTDATSPPPAAAMATLLWEQIGGGRVSHLITLDRDPRQWKVISHHTDDKSVSPQLIVEQSHAFLALVTKPAISPQIRLGDSFGTLVCVPVSSDPFSRVMIAVVPIRTINIQFLNELNDTEGIAAVLLDEQMRIMAAPDARMIGADVKTDAADPLTRSVAAKYAKAGKPGTEEFLKPTSINGAPVKAAIATAWPIDLPENKKWWLVVSSNLGEVDALLNSVFKRTAAGAAIVILVMTAILVSTSIQMIRNRIRLERIRHELLDKELGQAREIQLRWLPDSQGVVVATDIAAVNQPASHVSGDFYDWFELPDGRLVVTIGDVTGHGMAAAFLMATTQLLVRSTLPRVLDPGQCMEEVNRQLCQHVYSGQFVTLLIAILDLDRSTAEIATAGHPPPLVGDGEGFKMLPLRPHLVLGIDEHVTYQTQRITLVAGSSLLLYTDGVTDVQSPTGDRFTTEGVEKSLYGRFDSAQALIDTALDAVNAYRGSAPLGDDLTLVAIHLQPALAAETPTSSLAADTAAAV